MDFHFDVKNENIGTVSKLCDIIIFIVIVWEYDNVDIGQYYIQIVLDRMELWYKYLIGWMYVLCNL